MLICGKGGGKIAYIINTLFHKAGINFLGEQEDALQAGVLIHPKGKMIQPHTHKPKDVGVVNTMEVLYIQSGKIRCKFYDTDGTLLWEYTVKEGDIIIQFNGGHGFEFLEDSRIIEVKQGPYTGKEDDKQLL